MATPNYAYEKRQRELAKKRKKEEKATRKPHADSASDAGQNGYGTPIGSATSANDAAGDPQAGAASA